MTTVARAFRPDAVIERYYNFGGEAIGAATTVGAVGVLEVNAPLIEEKSNERTLLNREGAEDVAMRAFRSQEVWPQSPPGGS